MKSALSVLSVSRFYFDRGGAQAAFMALNRLLAQKGHRVTTLAGADPRNESPPGRSLFLRRFSDDRIGEMGLFDKLKAATDAVYSIDARSAVARLLSLTDFDVADVHSIYYQLSPSVFAPLFRAGVPVVHHLHDYAPFCVNGVMELRNAPCDRCRGHRYYNAVVNRCYHGSVGRSLVGACSKVVSHAFQVYLPRVSRFVVPSHFQKQLLTGLGIPADKTRILPLFVEVDGGARRTGFGGDFVLFAGEMKFRKGPQVVFEVAKRLHRTRFIFAGEGPMLSILRERASAENVRNVEFVGFLERARMSEALASAAIFVMPSITYESFGRVAIEAGAAGVPVVASRIGALPEVVEDGKTGLLFDPGNIDDLEAKLQSLISDRDLSSELGRAAQERVKSLYSPEAYYRGLMTVYEEVL